MPACVACKAPVADWLDVTSADICVLPSDTETCGLVALEAMASGIAVIAAEKATATPSCLGGAPMRRYMVGAFPFVLPVPGGPPQPPLASVTATIEWDGGPCK